MRKPRYYSSRLLNPFQGTAQVIDIGEGRALSNDGVNWRIQIKSEIYKSPWSSLGIAERRQPYFIYGAWSHSGGLARVPIHPTLYRDHVEEIASDVVRHLVKLSASVPYEPLDHIELWLMDNKRREPIVLIESCASEDELPQLERLHWSPLPAKADGFDSEVFRERRRRATVPMHVRDVLSQLVRQRTGTPPFGQWFRRHDDGSAMALHAVKGPSKLSGETLEAAQFPELLIASQWTDTKEQRLIDDYLAWLSPYLLTLPTLSDVTRSRLETQAIQRAVELEKVHRLYPRIINETMVKSALVEAVMRRSV